jgi:demethylmenaquinone methyltransferase/2-methoxy-6-polyprenyl-1,4-benzoquinol methylase
MAYAQESIKPYKDSGKSKKEQVRQMFDNIAHSYDRLNHALSFGVDKWWRQCAMNYLKRSGSRHSRILDIATGTGDFALLAYSELSPDTVVGCDISEGMLNIARQKAKSAGLDDKLTFCTEDCANMSFDTGSFDTVITAFALRNFENLDQCLTEIRRVMTDGGHIVAVDLCSPTTFPMKQLFTCYKKVIMPSIGKLISRDKSAYSYLPDTMEKVPQGQDMANILEKAGFKEVSFKRLAFGMSMLYTARK